MRRRPSAAALAAGGPGFGRNGLARRFCKPRAEPPRLPAKTARLRQAQEEAAAEVAAFRAQREEAYKKLVAGVRFTLRRPLSPA